MGYVKSMLPEDWDEETEAAMEEESKAKYLCLGNDTVEAHWLQRWYDVPFEECLFHHDGGKPESFVFIDRLNRNKGWDGIVLRPLPEGSDYKQKLKELKTERLLNGNDIR